MNNVGKRKVVHKRLVIFEGDEDWVNGQVFRSLPEGVKVIGGPNQNRGRTITVRIIKEHWTFLDIVERLIVKLLDSLRCI